MAHGTGRWLAVLPCLVLGPAACVALPDGSSRSDEVADLRARVDELEAEVDDLRGRVRVLDATIAHLYGLPE